MRHWSSSSGRHSHYQCPTHLPPPPLRHQTCLQCRYQLVDVVLLHFLLHHHLHFLHHHLLQITHPAGCFSQFLQYFGVSVFVLWRMALLKKRILLYSPPPIGVVCYRGELLYLVLLLLELSPVSLSVLHLSVGLTQPPAGGERGGYSQPTVLCQHCRH